MNERCSEPNCGGEMTALGIKAYMGNWVEVSQCDKCKHTIEEQPDARTREDWNG